MPVFRLLIAYDGTGFHGWARQPGLRTVQGVVEEAIGKMIGSAPSLSVAGRTDAGVHAAGQVASFTIDPDPDPERIKRAVNGMLSPEVVVIDASRARSGFDARRNARAREYVYRIDTSEVPSPFDARFVWHQPGDLSIERMREAAEHLVGEHDFASFCRAPKLPFSTTRTLRRLAASRRGARVEVRARADGFLHQMVRSLVGTLVNVGKGKLEPASMRDVLAARTRAAAGPVAPPHGLTLARVLYR